MRVAPGKKTWLPERSYRASIRAFAKARAPPFPFFPPHAARLTAPAVLAAFSDLCAFAALENFLAYAAPFAGPSLVATNVAARAARAARSALAARQLSAHYVS